MGMGGDDENTIPAGSARDAAIANSPRERWRYVSERRQRRIAADGAADAAEARRAAEAAAEELHTNRARLKRQEEELAAGAKRESALAEEVRTTTAHARKLWEERAAV
eukprot:gene37962-27710_t